MPLQPRHCVPVCATGCPDCGGRRQAPGRARSRDGMLLPPRRARPSASSETPRLECSAASSQIERSDCAASSSRPGRCAISLSAGCARGAFGFRSRVVATARPRGQGCRLARRQRHQDCRFGPLLLHFAWRPEPTSSFDHSARPVGSCSHYKPRGRCCCRRSHRSGCRRQRRPRCRCNTALRYPVGKRSRPCCRSPRWCQAALPRPPPP